MKINSRKNIISKIAPSYQKASKKEKTIILDEFIKITEYNRCYVRDLLRNHRKKNKSVSSHIHKNIKSKKPKTYDNEVEKYLVKLWEISQYTAKPLKCDLCYCTYARGTYCCI